MLRALLRLGLYFGVLAASQTASAANLRVVTFNVGMERVMDWRSRSTVQGVFSADPRVGRAHVLALQELCLNQPGALATFIELMRENHGVQYHFASYAASRGSACGKGQAVVSSYPIIDAGTLVLPRVGARRVAIWVDLRVEGPSYRRLRIYNVHFSNRAGWDLTPIEGRRRQACVVLQHAAQFRRRFEGAPIVVLGDFNSLGRLYDPATEEPAIDDLSRDFRATVDGFAPTMLLPYKVDWIFYSGLHLRRSKVAHVFFSDHFPVAADFDF